MTSAQQVGVSFCTVLRRYDAKKLHTKQQNVLYGSAQHTSLDRRANSDGFVRVDSLARVTSEQALDGLDDLGHSAHSTDQNDVVDLAGLDTGVGQSLLAGVNGPVDKGLDKSLELGPRKGSVDVLGAISSSGDVRQGDVGLRSRRELDLGTLGGLSNSLNGHPVLGEVDPFSLLELADKVVGKGNVKVLTTQMGVSVGRLDLEHSLLHLQDGDIESSTTEIVDGDDRAVRFVKTVGERRSSRLVDYSQYFETSDRTSVLGGLTLRIIEVSRYGDD